MDPISTFYQQNSLILGFIALNSIFALGMYVTLKSGAWSVAHPAFAALGAYTSVILSFTYQLPLVVGVAAAMLLAAVAALLLARPLLRLDGVFLAVASIALIQVTYVVALNATDLTGGQNGINGIAPVFAPWQLLLLVGALSVLFWRMDASRFGLAWDAVREGPAIARSVGIDPAAVRLYGFVAGSVIAALGGALHAWSTWTVHPSEFQFGLLVQIMSFVIVGGIARFWGPLIGAAFVTMIPEAVRYTAPYLSSLLSGLIIVVVLTLMPGGIAGMVLGGLPRLRRLRARPGSRPASTRAAPQALRPATPRRVAGADLEILTVQNVTVRYGGVTALDHVSFVLRDGVTGIIGPNGSGKTTLLNAISGFADLDAGTIRFAARDVTRMPAHERARLGIARTFQRVRLMRTWPLEDNIALASVGVRPRALDAVIALAEGGSALQRLRVLARGELAAIGVTRDPSTAAAGLPFGLQHRVELARCLAQAPSLLLLDEPSTGMTRSEWAELATLLRQLAATGVAIVIVEHNVDLVRVLCDRLIVLDFGRMIADGAPDAVRRDQRVISAYLGEEHALPIAVDR